MDQGPALALRAMPERMARQRLTRMSCLAGCGASKERLGKGRNIPAVVTSREELPEGNTRLGRLSPVLAYLAPALAAYAAYLQHQAGRGA